MIYMICMICVICMISMICINYMICMIYVIWIVMYPICFHLAFTLLHCTQARPFSWRLPSGSSLLVLGFRRRG